MSKAPYEDRTDPEKCQSQWWKLQGLHSREEWSAAIVRAATAAEIAANHAIRVEFSRRTQLAGPFVDSMLRWANGLAGKIDRLLIPLTNSTERQAALAGLRPLAAQINETRNAIVHRGEFRDEDEATAAIATTKLFIETLMRLYDPHFQLRNKKEKPTT
jgi:hypothetical protein